MALRTATFVDGANFRGNLRDFSFVSEPPHPDRPGYRLEEHHFDWKSFYDGMLQKFNEVTGWEHQLLRVHWYHAASISPWIPLERDRPRLAQRIVDQHQHIDGLTVEKVIALANSW